MTRNFRANKIRGSYFSIYYYWFM